MIQQNLEAFYNLDSWFSIKSPFHTSELRTQRGQRHENSKANTVKLWLASDHGSPEKSETASIYPVSARKRQHGDSDGIF